MDNPLLFIIIMLWIISIFLNPTWRNDNNDWKFFKKTIVVQSWSTIEIEKIKIKSLELDNTNEWIFILGFGWTSTHKKYYIYTEIETLQWKKGWKLQELDSDEINLVEYKEDSWNYPHLEYVEMRPENGYIKREANLYIPEDTFLKNIDKNKES